MFSSSVVSTRDREFCVFIRTCMHAQVKLSDSGRQYAQSLHLPNICRSGTENMGHKCVCNTTNKGCYISLHGHFSPPYFGFVLQYYQCSAHVCNKCADRVVVSECSHQPPDSACVRFGAVRAFACTHNHCGGLCGGPRGARFFLICERFQLLCLTYRCAWVDVEVDFLKQLLACAFVNSTCMRYIFMRICTCICYTYTCSVGTLISQRLRTYMHAYAYMHAGAYTAVSVNSNGSTYA